MLDASRLTFGFALIIASLVPAQNLCAQATTQPAPRPAHPHVLIISIDGGRPDCILRADMPALRELMRRGSFTMWATTTDVAITTPSHVSMLTGVTPERHGISFNADPPDDAVIKVPTIFDLAKRAGYTTAMASGKRKFTLFSRTHAIDWQWLTSEAVVKDDRDVADHAADLVREHRPDVMLVHFPGADVAGHGIGWGTPEQIEKLDVVDQGIGRVLKAYRDAGLIDQTYVIVSADHGGTVRTHGAGDVRSHFIPWIIAGPAVRQDYDLTRLGKQYDVRTYDTFATACHVLNIPVPADSDGKPVLPIFVDYDLLLAADPASNKPDPARAYMTAADTTATSRPVWRGAGKVPTTSPTATVD